jgi:hypothetical protein
MVPAGRVVMGRTRCEYCGGDVESAGIGGTICNADRGPNDEGPAAPMGRKYGRVPCNICGDEMTLDTRRRRPLADGAGWDGAVCADCTGDGGHAKLAAMRDAGDVVGDAERCRTADHPANADRYRR